MAGSPYHDRRMEDDEREAAPYRAFAPGPLLAPFVECLWRYRDPAAAGGATEAVLPDGCIELIIHVGAPFRERSESGRATGQPRALVAGQLTRRLLLEPAGPVETWAVRFRPAGAFRFFRPPLELLTDRTAALDDLVGARLERELCERMAAAGGDLERARVLRGWLLDRTPRDVDSDRPIERAVGGILARAGAVRIDRLASEAGMSDRQLERRFLARVGLTPKALCRIVRFQNVLRLLPPDRRPAWADLALEGGYSDQAHLIREFRSLSGATPERFLRAEGRLSRHLTSSERLRLLFAVAHRPARE
jgi:AraC-like DNA-binding protein